MSKLAKANRLPCLAILWDQDHLRYVAGTPRKQDIEILAAGILERRDDESDGEMITRLREEIPKAGRNNVCVGLSKNQVEVFDIALPAENSNLMIEMVRNEVLRQSSEVKEDWSIDYNLDIESEERLAKGIAFAVSPETIEKTKSDLKKDGFKANSINIRHLSALSLLKELAPKASVSRNLFINQSKNEIDLLVLREGNLIYARTIRHDTSSQSEEDIQLLVSEVQRTIMVAPDNDDSESMMHIYMFGSPARQNAIGAKLAESAQIPVTTIDPFAVARFKKAQRPPERHLYASLMGMLLDSAAKSPSADLLNPPKPKSIFAAYSRYAILAALLLVAFGVFAFLKYRDVTDLTAGNDATRTEIKKLKEQIKKLKKRTAIVDEIDAWRSGDITWLDQISELNALLPPASDLKVLNMSYAPEGKSGGRINMRVRAKDPAVAQRIANLRNENIPYVKCEPLVKSKAQSELPWSFEVVMRIRNRDKTEFVGYVPPPETKTADTDDDSKESTESEEASRTQTVSTESTELTQSTESTELTKGGQE